MPRECRSQRASRKSQSTDHIANSHCPAKQSKFNYQSSHQSISQSLRRLPSETQRDRLLGTFNQLIMQKQPSPDNDILVDTKTFIFPASASIAREDSEQSTLIKMLNGEQQDEKCSSEESKISDSNKRSLRSKSPGRIQISPSSVSFHEDSYSVINEQRAGSSEVQYAMGRSISQVEQMIANSRTWKDQGALSTVDAFSFLYGILLIVMGTAFPVSQVISNLISSHYYEGFYAYLYFVSIAIFAYVYLMLHAKINIRRLFPCKSKCVYPAKDNATSEVQEDEDESLNMREIAASKLRSTLEHELDPHYYKNHGSFYLRIGAVVFGIGAMIYAALEFGQYFEMSVNPHCDDIMLAVQPFTRALFTFFQMYFVFLNSKLQTIKQSNIIFARFALMHLVATNYCVWLNAIVQETRHEIVHASQGTHQVDSHHIQDGLEALVNDTTEAVLAASAMLFNQHSILKRSLSDECQRTDIMGALTQDASPFLFPCAIEYSLICAAIMYEIWRQSSELETSRCSIESLPGSRTPHTPDSARMNAGRRSPHHYSVDCTKANKGLFIGIFVLVMTIVSMILFFVLINRDKYRDTAITEVYMSELTLYIMTFGAVLIGIVQVRKLHFNATRPLDLDCILLVIALTGVIAYNVFTIVATQFSTHEDRLLIFVNALMAVLQAVAQTMFVVDASKRHLYTRRQQKNKPGREVITFLMVTNFAMWAIITLEKSRVEAHPVQNQFFGLWPWAIISNISSPLSIFYRYHSTVCLCEIWKRCYKVQTDKQTTPPSVA